MRESKKERWVGLSEAARMLSLLIYVFSKSAKISMHHSFSIFLSNQLLPTRRASFTHPSDFLSALCFVVDAKLEPGLLSQN